MNPRLYRVATTAVLGVVLVVIIAACSDESGSGYPIKPTTSLVNEGRPIYQANCASCHGDALNPPPLPTAPKHTADGHTWHHSDQQLVGWVLDGVPNGQVMPKFRDSLTESQVQATVAYIKTFWPDEVIAMQARGMH